MIPSMYTFSLCFKPASTSIFANIPSMPQMLLGLAALLMASAVPTNLAEQVPAFEVPNFDYQTLSTGNTPNDVLDALKKDGIISFTNVPSYAQVRRSYLDSAAACAVSAQEVNAEFLLFKTLTDGTNRYTISTPSGQDADATATTTDAACPGYKTIYDEFSSLLELVVLNVATTLDATTFTTTDGYGKTVSSRKLMTDAVRLDHFHAYETPSLHERRLMSADSGTQASTSDKDDLSLELHEDDGMFIVFATPAFYKVNNDGANSTFKSVQAGGEDDSESGLIIQRRDGQRVRPILKPDQVTLMVGTGYNRWVGTSEQLPAVMHGMRMPEVKMTETQRLLRAWFGKMTLLPSYQRMLKQMDFGEHANTTAQYVQQGHQSDHQLLGCAPGRHLLASADAACSYKECTVKAGATAPSEGCSVVCNRGHSTDPAACSKSCSCTASSHSATSCWMLCVKDLDTCARSKQSCSGQTRVCS
ncbi:hypothetical protein PPTG_15967 [Phytophthora nicotianae INRA-310]|uniref:Uncharacterized protein n=1 Tax=Phytophthora nicotianae (strain INRA-310) TaxID=761204 RepID=W2PS78_PHYN3|nr:hypothetical protein PPTG_15967 [Phytophthora nicotianae INRA-310]ETN03772.1 hypothetical protein PPTG_15967 [Phytophthora nicotianae INRA-310]